ncbi:MAG TPA: methionyl-tRNA formyltransferase, partial [Vicinamibacterales bacterium]
GYLTLDALVKSSAEIAGVVSLQQDSHEVERYETPIRRLALANRIPHCETRSLTDRDRYVDLLTREMKPDVAIVVGCRMLIAPEIYQAPPLGTLAVHDSLLPEYRGFAPLNWSILNGEDHTGVTLFHLTESADAGDIVAQRRVPIGPDDTAPVVYERVCQATVDLVLDTYPQLAAGTAPRTPQAHHRATFACSRTPIDGEIDWSAPTAVVYNRVRALTYPYPGAYTYYRGRPLTIWSASRVENSPSYVGRIPGRVVSVSKTTGGIDVLTGDGVLRVHDVQFVTTSVRAALGLQTTDLLARIQALEERIAALSANLDRVNEQQGVSIDAVV